MTYQKQNIWESNTSKELNHGPCLLSGFKRAGETAGLCISNIFYFKLHNPPKINMQKHQLHTACTLLEDLTWHEDPKKSQEQFHWNYTNSVPFYR